MVEWPGWLNSQDGRLLVRQLQIEQQVAELTAGTSRSYANHL
jgi:hypothetical protein